MLRKNNPGKIWRFSCNACLISISIIIAPVIFIVMGLAYGMRSVVAEILFFWDMAFLTDYRYKILGER